MSLVNVLRGVFCVCRNRVIFHTYESKATVSISAAFVLLIPHILSFIAKKENWTTLSFTNKTTPHFMKTIPFSCYLWQPYPLVLISLKVFRPPIGNFWELSYPHECYQFFVVFFFLVGEMKMKSSTGRQSDSKILENGPQILDFRSHIL